jgi:hypothetical protein
MVHPRCAVQSLLPVLCSGTDAWSIHKGSCGYGWLDKSVRTGRFGIRGGYTHRKWRQGPLVFKVKADNAIDVLKP